MRKFLIPLLAGFLLLLGGAAFNGQAKADVVADPPPVCNPHIPCGAPPEFESVSPPPLRHAYPAKGNLPKLRRDLLRGCIPDPRGEVCPLPAPHTFNMCVNSPTKSFLAACGGYPLPPLCSVSNAHASWFGHFWGDYYYNLNLLVYGQSSFVCDYNVRVYNQFFAQGIDPRSGTGGYVWLAIIY